MKTVEQLLEEHAQRKRRVWVEGDEVVLDADGQKYRFELDRCDTPEKVLDWCIHLSEKTWVTGLHIRDFILLMHEVNKVPIDFWA